jgi:hypothetical protein
MPTSNDQAQTVISSTAVTSKDVAFLWKALIIGLIAVLGISLAGTLYAALDGDDKTSPEVLITVFTTTFAGLVGLFVRSPAGK